MFFIITKSRKYNESIAFGDKTVIDGLLQALVDNVPAQQRQKMRVKIEDQAVTAKKDAPSKLNR